MPAKPDPTSTGLPLIECDLELGLPGLIAHNELTLSGWAASPKGIAGVAVQIGERQWNAAYGLDTPSLAERLPDAQRADRAGYRLTLDTSAWDAGTHYVTVAAFDVEGGRSAIEGAIEVHPIPDPSLDPPEGPAAAQSDEVELGLDPPLSEAGAQEIEGPLTVSGWAHASEGIEAVTVTVDGIPFEAPMPVSRPDLLSRFGREVAADAGFAIQLDPSDCPPGRHSLAVSVLSRNGRVAGTTCEVLCRPQSGSATTVEWMSERVPPQLRDDDTELTDAERMWQSRALLAEADAARCRAEARLAQAGEVRARRELSALRGPRQG